MINQIKLNNNFNIAQNTPISASKVQNGVSSPISSKTLSYPQGYKPSSIGVNTTLTQSESEKYLALVNALKNQPVSENSFNTSATKQLDCLLKNGKLLAKSNNDNSTTLDNLYNILTKPRCEDFNPLAVLSNTLDILANPRIITQNFGDIPKDEEAKILSELPKDSPLQMSPETMDIQASAVCAAASNEVNLADKYPAEFVRWVEGLSGENKAVYSDIWLDSISKNKLDAITILNLMDAKKVDFNLDKVKIKISPDDNAYKRAKIQEKHWDKGERNLVDVLIQSTIMQLGSQNTYDSLTDTRGGIFSDNTEGLIEIEKTFVESVIKNKEVTSLVYQKIDDNQNLVGYNCSFDKMEKHIKDTIDSGDDVIIGNVLTNETSGMLDSGTYDPKINGEPNKIINGHEITIVGYDIDKDGKTVFRCIDTDDDSPDFVYYSADYLLPKLHHAGYPAQIVEKDEKEIMSNVA